MSNVNTFLKENLPSVSKNIFVAPGIPEKKLNNVAKAFNVADNLNAVLGKVRISRSFLPKLTR
ncbi:hypothetical protein M8448_08120 [Citrobacter freundii]|uniref:hypothetical protein n=1 Tax=Citrobacter freundii TaxID=546 RepID=UPI00214DAEE9|nr:hypothetical protein [Citrobacter freundii]MCR3709471.1 hypothetical protein [Citrobacter freundii]